MPVLRVYQQGCTAGVPPSRNDHLRTKRGKVGGWSTGAVRRNTRFLYSIRAHELTGDGYAFTLTLKHCPPTHDAWHSLRRVFLDRLRRMGMIRLHWVTEWQKRGVPHLHGCVFFPRATQGAVTAVRLNSRCLLRGTEAQVRRAVSMVGHWLEAAWSYDAGHSGQHIALMSDAVGWFQYVAKHASRGVKHYQRDPSAIPEGWTGTGRMWGQAGQWPTDDAISLHLERGGFFRFRRLVRSLMKAQARAEGDPRRIRHTRQMLACPRRALSEVRGVSEWLNIETQLQAVHAVAAEGYEVSQR